MKKILLIEQIPNEGWAAPDYFKKNDYDVYFFDLTPFYSSLMWRCINKFNYNFWLSAITYQIENAVAAIEPNFVVFWNLDYITSFGLTKIKETSSLCKLVCWHGDDLLNPRFNIEDQLKKIPLIDIHVTARHHLVSEYYNLGASFILPVSWYRKSLRIETIVPEFNLSFFGSIDNKRESYLKALNIPPSHIGGNGWNRSGLGDHSVLHHHLSLNSMNDLIAKSKVSLNFLTEKNRDATNFRNFEIPSQRSLQICERSQELNDIFNEDVGIVLFSSIEELNEKVNFYLKNENARLKVIEYSYSIASNYKYSFDYQLDLLDASLNY
jgi:hypothetical protein